MTAVEPVDTDPSPLPAPVVAALVDVVTARVYGRPAYRCTRAELTALRDRLRRLAAHHDHATTERTTVTTTASTPTAPPSPPGTVDPVRLAAFAALAGRACEALDAAARYGAGAQQVRAAQGQADRAEARLHQALLLAVPGYEPADLDAEIDRLTAAGARAAR